jgi:peptidoglycan/xylan/chitin deacetylase (PgdA/CDA1 family)
MSTIPYRFIVTVDDPGGLMQDLALFDRARRFFDTEGVPASFMVVPRGEGGFLLDQQPAWLNAVRAAERDGHDCQLHGLDHKDCEFGPYPMMIQTLHGPDAPAQAERERQQFGPGWNRETYLDKIQTAIAIYERAFDRRPTVFRTGALSQTTDLYGAMEDAGFRYTSNTVTDPRGWQYIVENYDNPGEWDPEVPAAPYYLTDEIVNLPIMSEYAWYLTPEKIDRHLALAVDDLHRVEQASRVFILVCHVQCVGAQDGLSQQLLHRLIEVARTDCGATFETLAGLVSEIESNTVPVGKRI